MPPRQSYGLNAKHEDKSLANHNFLVVPEPSSLSRHQAKNRYYRHSRISEELFLHVLEEFCRDLTATECANITGISVRSVNSIYLKLRRWLADSDNNSTDINTAKQDVYKLAVDEDDINLTVISDQDINAAQELIAAPTLAGNDQIWDQLNGALALLVPNRSRLKRRLDLSIKQHAVLDDFWEFTRQRLPRFNGIHKHTLSLHLQETAFRFNQRDKDMYQYMIEQLEQRPI